MPLYISSTIVSVPGIVTTPTDGVLIQNTTPATAGVPVQMSPRARWSGTAWDTAASESVAFFAEVLPATAATPTGTWKLGYSLNGGAATYPLTVSNLGVVTSLSGYVSGGDVGVASLLKFGNGANAIVSSSGSGQLTLRDNSLGFGVQFKADALPTVASGGGTSPSITAGSTPLAGSVNIGTGGVATSIVINFNGTAFPSAPFVVATTSLTNAVVRATASTTQLTLTSTTAWTASDVITWHAISSK
jgi:hypothetical protein